LGATTRSAISLAGSAASNASAARATPPYRHRHRRRAAAPLRGEELFTPAEDDWWLERSLAQLACMRSLAHEGWLFVAIGRRA
jgi:hypothetical protein